MGCLTQEEDRAQLGSAGADVSHLAEPAARRREDNTGSTDMIGPIGGSYIIQDVCDDML